MAVGVGGVRTSVLDHHQQRGVKERAAQLLQDDSQLYLSESREDCQTQAGHDHAVLHVQTLL